MTKLYISLLHYPVYNRKGEVSISSVTATDIHDISRVCATFGVDKFYVVHPHLGQLLFIRRILKHWLYGHGFLYNPERASALKCVVLRDSFSQVLWDIKISCGLYPKVVATTAKLFPKKSIPLAELKKEKDPILLVFGTGWGLCEEFINSCDLVLYPIFGVSFYNHLSVRSAVAIILHKLSETF